ncbi:hypothetical protein LZ31DRAFT_363396 [Colletotrichum somersetense]|nr:hypothetical protein LZ31DRAFT_363396 [Colletotrichum somersetense]
MYRHGMLALRMIHGVVVCLSVCLSVYLPQFTIPSSALALAPARPPPLSSSSSSSSSSSNVVWPALPKCPVSWYIQYDTSYRLQHSPLPALSLPHRASCIQIDVARRAVDLPGFALTCSNVTQSTAERMVSMRPKLA